VPFRCSCSLVFLPVLQSPGSPSLVCSECQHATQSPQLSSTITWSLMVKRQTIHDQHEYEKRGQTTVSFWGWICHGLDFTSKVPCAQLRSPEGILALRRLRRTSLPDVEGAHPCPPSAASLLRRTGRPEQTRF
jgi:hypothetical protein